jgi:dipeptidyl aminopeptidase/acylaminoacyl peptidase
MLHALLPLLVPSVPIQETHPFGVEDMLAMDRISDPCVSPGGEQILFNVRVTDLAANKGRTDVWMAELESGVLRRLTTHEASDGNARWLDERTILFLSTRSGSSQVWKLSLDGGEAEQLTKLPLDVDNLFVFPDGKRIGFSLEVYPDAKSIQETVDRDQAREKDPVKARVYESLLFRHWDSWEDKKRKHLFVWTIGGGDPIDLMSVMDADSPTNPFGGTEQIAVSPDGAEVVFVAKDDGRANAWTTNLDLWSVPSDGSAAPRRITADNPALDDQPAFSPDGRWLAWVAMQRPGYEADRQRIVLLERASGSRRVLTEAWDRSVAEYCWDSESQALYVGADDVGNHALFRIDLRTGEPRNLVAKGTNTSPRSGFPRVIYLHDSLTEPAELRWIVDPTVSALPHDAATGQMSPQGAITGLNAAKVAAARFGAYEPFSFPGAKGDTVHGFLVKPVDFNASKKYPVAFLIHGGPQGTFGDHFHYRWNAEAFAGAGYAAVMIDFHGSTGYGQAFCDAIREDWGGAPYEDLMKGLDFVLAKYSFLDGKRVGALGASFGGYMINWIAGQTDRFQCLVNHDGNLDERMAYFDTEELWFPEWDHGGLPWEKPESYAKHNPIENVAKWKTPMLVIHGGQDFRVVETQGMSTFTALQRRGIPSRFVYFPDENHWVQKPLNSRFWHGEVLGWLDRWLKPEAGTR